MVAIYAYNGYDLDMTVDQLPASAADPSTLEIDEFTNTKLMYWFDINDKTFGAELTGSQFHSNTDPLVNEFDLLDSNGFHMYHIGEFNYSYSEFA